MAGRGEDCAADLVLVCGLAGRAEQGPKKSGSLLQQLQLRSCLRKEHEPLFPAGIPNSLAFPPETAGPKVKANRLPL